MICYPTQLLRKSGINPVKLTRSLPCLGGILLTGISEDGATMAVVPKTDGSRVAEWDDSRESRDCRTVLEARVWLTLMSFGFSKELSDEWTEKIMEVK